MLNKLLILFKKTTFSLALAAIVITPASAQKTLKSPYSVPIPKLQQIKNPSCPKIPSPPKNLVFQGIYTDRTKGLSIVDTKAQDKYRDQTKPIRYYENKISQWTEKAITQKSTNALSCAILWLDDWAEKDALLYVENNFQGESVRKWTLGSLSSHYLQIKKTGALKKHQKNNIENWLKETAEQVIEDYAQNPKSKSRNNNHMYWAAWSVMITGVALNNHDFYNWGVKKYKHAINDVEDDGTFPLEVARQGKAFNYHVFAASPLILMAETGHPNGDNLYDYNNKKIHKFVTMVLSELNSGQQYLRYKTGVKQDIKSTITSSMLAWVTPYHKRFGTEETEKTVNEYAPMKQRRLGGNMNLLFNVDTSKNKSED